LVAQRWGLNVVPSLLEHVGDDDAAGLYHSGYASESMLTHGLRGRAYLAAHGIPHHPRTVGQRRAKLLEDHTVLSLAPLAWLLTNSSRDVIVVEPIAAALAGAFWISSSVARGGYDFGEDAISRDVETFLEWRRQAKAFDSRELWVPCVPPEFIREIYVRTESRIPRLKQWASKTGLAVRVRSLTEFELQTPLSSDNGSA
jgi:hypothetical protein